MSQSFYVVYKQEDITYFQTADKLTERMSTLEHTITVQDDTICTLTTSLERETELRTSTEV